MNRLSRSSITLSTVIASVLSMSALFLIIGMLRFDIRAASWFYLTTMHSISYSWLFRLCCNSVASMALMVGIAMPLMPGVFLWAAYALVRKKSISYERFCALSIVIFTTSIIGELYGYQLMSGLCGGGGLIGIKGKQWFFSQWDLVPASVLLGALLWVSAWILLQNQAVYMALLVKKLIHILYAGLYWMYRVGRALKKGGSDDHLPSFLRRILALDSLEYSIQEYQEEIAIDRIKMVLSTPKPLSLSETLIKSIKIPGSQPSLEKTYTPDDACAYTPLVVHQDEYAPLSYQEDSVHTSISERYSPDVTSVQESYSIEQMEVNREEPSKVAVSSLVKNSSANQAWGNDHKEEMREREKKSESVEEKITILTDYHLPTMVKWCRDQSPLSCPEFDREIALSTQILEEKLERFGISGKVMQAHRGPVITVFEYAPDSNIKLSRIKALEDDLALALQTVSLRILAPIPGTAVVGFEVANRVRQTVSFAQMVSSHTFKHFEGPLPLVLGSTTSGTEVVVDLAKMPHVLVAGSTGSGKSVALNAMLVSLLCKRSPDELRLILIDPKRLEFATYSDIAHLMFPIITVPQKAIEALKWAVAEMTARYERMASLGVKNINDHHARLGSAGLKDMPYIVIVIDELADLMMTAGKEVEQLIARIAQMARAAGIHLIVATQRPSVDVITGLIKVNFPSRISFRVTSKVDSRTILDTMGAERLLGKGDMLFLYPYTPGLQRIHGAWMSDEEVLHVVDHIRAQRAPAYQEMVEAHHEEEEIDERDRALYNEVLDFVQEVDEISISLLQRKFKIGFNRSARLMDILESQGFIAVGEHGKMKKVVKKDSINY